MPRVAEDVASDVVRTGRESGPERSLRSAPHTSRTDYRLAREGSGWLSTRPDPKPKQDHITLKLTTVQVSQVIRDSGRRQSPMSSLLSALWDPDWKLALQSGGQVGPWQLDDPRLSRTLLLGLLVFASFRPDGTYRRVIDIAQMLEMRPSTAHRYLATLVAVGLLERDSVSRKYRNART